MVKGVISLGKENLMICSRLKVIYNRECYDGGGNYTAAGVICDAGIYHVDMLYIKVYSTALYQCCMK